MAQLDIYRTADGQTLLNFQNDIFDHLDTRFVIPLLSPADGPKVMDRLNPIFLVDNDPMALYPQYAFTIPVAELQDRIGSLVQDHFAIIAAMDMLMSGY